MRPIQYTTRQCLVTYSLLISLFLQSCNCNANYSLKPQPSHNLSVQQPPNLSIMDDLGRVGQLTHSTFIPITPGDLSITNPEDTLLANVVEGPQATQPIQHTASPALVWPLREKPANTPPRNTRGSHQQPIHTSNKTRKVLPTTLVHGQQALSERQATNKQAKIEIEENQPIGQELSSQGVPTKPGQTITFCQESGNWKAIVDEQYGSLHRSQDLPLYFQGPSLPAHLKPSQIHIVEANGVDGKKQAVYVGKWGLPGGMVGALTAANSTNKEIILFCGNPGVGKSALCNSIFQEAKFRSGLSSTGLTKFHQGYAFDNKIYVDTPGLADEKRQKEAAQEIEAALKKNGNYKIIFVIAFVSGRLRPEDIETVNTICKSIHTPFEYGLIINMLTDNARRKFESDENEYLSLFFKRPSLTCKIKKEEKMEDAEDVFITDPRTRKELTDFINNLKANKIISENVQPIDLTDYKNKVIEANKKIEHLEQELKQALNRPQPAPTVTRKTSVNINIGGGLLEIVGGLLGGHNPTGPTIARSQW